MPLPLVNLQMISKCKNFKNLTQNSPPKYKDLDHSATKRREKQFFLLHFYFFFSVVIKRLS